MSHKQDMSREEIAKQFLLPERQSKINTLLRQDGQAYCICRSSDSSRFMIACDACEEWYHGDCIGISEREAKRIKQYFCVRCCEEDPTLQTRWKAKRDDSRREESRREDVMAQLTTVSASGGTSRDEHRSKKRRDRSEKKPDKKQKKCGECMGCYRTEDCGRCDVCVRKHKHGSSANRQKERCKMRLCINYGGHVRRRRRDSSSDRELASNSHLMTDYPRQCYGPECVRSARYGSKYCCDECGMKLASHRIYRVLPQRIQEWVLSPCVAEESNIKALDQVRKQQLEVTETLQRLDEKHKQLDVIIERAKSAMIDLNQDQDNEEEGDLSTYCITCGLEIHSRTAIKHMEKCFNKYEAQSSFGSKFKTRIEGNNMFCDFYNPSSGTYCKRLRVLCPEHSKDPKVGDNEVCGCPLVTNVFEKTGDFCLAPKKSCAKHHVWEKLRRAEIDLERVRQWMKMDELLEKERQIRQAMASRAGVLPLILHSTYNHEVMEEFTKASQQDQVAIQKEIAKRIMKGGVKHQDNKR